jgi:hypothetical protein
MKFKVEISLGNDAFADQPSAEVERILRAVTRDVHLVFARREAEGFAAKTRLFDMNGNVVGKVWISKS